MAELHDILPRHKTPPARTLDGSTRITVQRCCNGCGYSLGDVTFIEIELAIAGATLPDVRMECPNCRPSMDPPLRVARTCRHCGAEIVPCNPAHENPVCKGWKHTQFIDSMPVGAHYCDGRSVNPSAEPAPETAKEDGDG